VIAQLELNGEETTSGVTIIDALCNPKYRRATWINIGYIFFHEMTGINVIG
jgi:hypothetical protein